MILRSGLWLRVHWLPVVLVPAALLAHVLLLRKTRRGRMWLDAIAPCAVSVRRRLRPFCRGAGPHDAKRPGCRRVLESSLRL